MGVEVKNAEVIVRAVREKLEKMQRALEPALQDAATQIVVRTQSGNDVDGNAFAEYSPGYAKYRDQKGRSTSPVDLTFTGNMLNAIQTKVEQTATGTTGTIFFGSALEAAKARGNQQRRKFFGLSDEQVAQVKRKLENAK